MSQTTLSPTGPLPFITTFSTSHSATSFTRPTAVPSIVPFGPAFSCESANPSNAPINNPQGSDAACAISNAREINDHAFWDLYACCKGGNITANGAPFPCTAQCEAKGQTWRDVGECLSKRVDVVVCKAKDGEVVSVSRNSTGSSVSSASGGKASGSTGEASVVGVMHVGGSKAAAMVFGVLAIVSFAGMML